MRSLVLVSFLAACGDGGSTTPDANLDAAPREVITESKLLLVGELAEGILVGGPGDVAIISLEAPLAKLDWNLHGHANGSTQVVEEGFEQMSVRYTFTPGAQAEWLLLVRNKDSAPMTVEVEIALHGAMEWSGWE